MEVKRVRHVVQNWVYAESMKKSDRSPGIAGGLGPRVRRSSTDTHHASELIVSPPERVPAAHQAVVLTVCLMNRTEPSHIPTLTPPECMLLAVAAAPSLTLLSLQLQVLGSMTWL